MSWKVRHGNGPVTKSRYRYILFAKNLKMWKGDLVKFRYSEKTKLIEKNILPLFKMTR